MLVSGLICGACLLFTSNRPSQSRLGSLQANISHRAAQAVWCETEIQKITGSNIFSIKISNMKSQTSEVIIRMVLVNIETLSKWQNRDHQRTTEENSLTLKEVTF